MSDGNRIRRYEGIWSTSNGVDRRTSHGGAPAGVPPGFAVFPLAHWSPAEQQAIAAQADLYQRAYDLARRAADQHFVLDWMI